MRLFSSTSSATRPSISSRRPSNSRPNGPPPASRWTCPAGIAAGMAATTGAGSGHTASMRPASHARIASGISIIGARVPSSRMLFDPRAHEAVLDAQWNPADAEAAIREIARDTEDALSERDWWPVHPLDVEDGDPEVWHGVYMGAAGVVWALEQ